MTQLFQIYMKETTRVWNIIVYAFHVITNIFFQLLRCSLNPRTRVGNFRTVVISDYEAARAAFASPNFVDRASFFKIFDINPEEPGG